MGFDSGTRAHFHSKSFQRLIYLDKNGYFTLMERVCESQYKFVVNSLIWSNHFDADAFFHFMVLIRIIDDISTPNHSKDSLILITSEYFTLMERVCESQFKFVG